MLLFKRASTSSVNVWFWSINFKVIITVFILLLIGIVLDISASPYVAIRLHAYPLYFVYRHIFYVSLAFCVLIGVSFLNEQQLKKLSIVIFIIGIIGILVSLMLNDAVKGSRRWVHLMGFSLQPSELVKVCFPIILAMVWDKFKLISKPLAYLIMFVIYFGIVGLIIIQPDLGMTILISTIFITILFITEINFAWILLLSIIGLIFLIVAYFMFMHVQYRIDTFFGNTQSYQVIKALEAIKEGGFWGTGPGLGVVKAYLPDAHTDFIFAVGIEEYGIIFAVILILIYGYLFFNCFKMIANETKSFNYISVTGLTICLVVQSFIHMSTNIDLLPAKGVTLPFISYGGTALVTNAMLVGFLLVLTKKKY